MTTLLLVEDEEDLAFGMAKLLARQGHDVDRAATAAEAMRLAAICLYDVIVLDLGLPDGDGLEVLGALRAAGAGPVIVQTGRDDAGTAVKALRLGAADYLTKPVDSKALSVAIGRALEATALRRALEAARRRSRMDGDPLGSSPAWQAVLAAVRSVASATRTPVLLHGESGTGKELVAEMVHRESPCAAGPFVTVNAACFSTTLLESELFGHEVGAFTDARKARRGLFEMAAGGTLFLDEVAELPPEIQPKLLRVLEGHPFRRVGGEREIHCDVRVVCASNRRLAAEVAAGRLREDLYHRLKVVEIDLPPLRERAGDVRELAVEFLARLGGAAGRADLQLQPETLAILERYAWPGNVRELKNAVERAVIFAPGREIRPEDLPLEIRVAAGGSPPAAFPAGPVPAAPAPGADESLAEVVRRHVRAVFDASGGNLTLAARRLGISRPTVRQHLRAE